MMRLVIPVLIGWLAINAAVALLLTVAGVLRERRRRHGARVRTVISHGQRRGVLQ